MKFKTRVRHVSCLALRTRASHPRFSWLRKKKWYARPFALSGVERFKVWSNNVCSTGWESKHFRAASSGQLLFSSERITALLVCQIILKVSDESLGCDETSCVRVAMFHKTFTRTVTPLLSVTVEYVYLFLSHYGSTVVTSA